MPPVAHGGEEDNESGPSQRPRVVMADTVLSGLSVLVIAQRGRWTASKP
jgi:hypothetical protein